VDKLDKESRRDREIPKSHDAIGGAGPSQGNDQRRVAGGAEVKDGVAPEDDEPDE
jgi:hypothetical protein